jgi:hypothetical protein
VLTAALVALPAGASAAPPGTRDVLYVANNWDGTAHIVDPETFRKLGRINVIPDRDQRMREIATNPVRLGYFLGVRLLVGEGNDQYVDDMFSSPDGRFVYISRPSFADVVGINLRTRKIAWRYKLEGHRSDHMAIKRDGSQLIVSDSTARKVHALDPRTGQKIGEFPSGDSPHENNYSANEERIFHASIGHVWTPADRPLLDSTKGDRWFQIVDTDSITTPTPRIIKRLDIGKIMAAHGHEGFSSAVRPMAIAPGERIVYMQLSFLHGFVEFDVERERPLRIARLPKRTNEPRENYLLDSAHHGLNINGDGTRLCAAGTMDNYAAIVNRSDFRFGIINVGEKPYWSTNNGDGSICFVSVSGDDRVSVISYASRREIARIPVGDHPQRMRMGRIRSAFVSEAGDDPSGGRPSGSCDITGTPGNDILRGTSRDEWICGGGGNDVIYGGGGEDRIEGDAGNDVLRGDAGDDRMDGGRGDDELVGGPGDDGLTGGAGRDVLSGQGGGDDLDTADAVRRNDVANGGPGRDSCLVDPGDQRTSC